jgi:hypothetical protein
MSLLVGGELLDHLGAEGSDHGVLAEQAQLQVAGVMGVVAVDHDPVLAAAGSVGQLPDPLDGGLGGGVGEPSSTKSRSMSTITSAVRISLPSPKRRSCPAYLAAATSSEPQACG